MKFEICVLGWMLVVCGSLKQRAWLGPAFFLQSSFPAQRSGHKLALSGDLVYLFGQSKEAESDSDFYSLGSDGVSWLSLVDSSKGTVPISRSNHALAASAESIFVHGGIEPNYVLLGDLYAFSPSTLTWAEISNNVNGTSPSPRFLHGMAFASGSLYIFGGFQSDFLNDHFLLNLSSMSWTEISDIENSPSPRLGHCFVAMGTLLFLHGGRGPQGYLQDLWLFDTVALSWMNISSNCIGPPPPARDRHGCTLLDGSLFIHGGSGEEGVLDDLFEFQISTQTWTNLSGNISGVPPSKRYDHGFVSIGSLLVVHGGSDFVSDLGDLYLLDVSIKQWIHVTGVISGQAPPVLGGHSLLTSGSSLFTVGGGLDDVFIFDLRATFWKKHTNSEISALLPKRWYAGCALMQGRIFMHGGSNGQESMGDLLVYDLKSSFWTNLSNFSFNKPTPRQNHGLVILDSTIYIFGGLNIDKNKSQTFLGDFFKCNIDSLVFEEISTSFSPSPRAGHGITFIGNLIYIHAGDTIEGFQSDLYVFNTLSMDWTDLTQSDSPAPRANHGFVSFESKLFVFGGRQFFGTFDDSNLFMYDTQSMKWTLLNTQISGRPPDPRYSHAMTVSGGNLYIFGGQGRDDLFNDLMVLSLPSDRMWKSSGCIQFIIMFDWDRIFVSADIPSELSFSLNLCVGLLPCSLNIRGLAKGELYRSPKGSISCHFEDGCQNVVVENLRLGCLELCPKSVFEIKGSSLEIRNSNFSYCHTQSAGSIVMAFALASVHVIGSVFENLRSEGEGGAIFALGSNISIQNTLFVNSSSSSGGGALWAGAYESCFGDKKAQDTKVVITSTEFRGCRSDAAGGSVLVYCNSDSAQSGNLSCTLLLTKFTSSNASDNGGALAAAGKRTTMYVLNSSFESCNSGSSGGGMFLNQGATSLVLHSFFGECSTFNSGGAISADDGRLFLYDIIFTKNSAQGLGGGALHLRASHLFIFGSLFTDNTAEFGGGGAIFWQQFVHPTDKSICPEGMSSVAVTCLQIPKSMDCSWLTCTHCGIGTFQSAHSASFCAKCPTGSFSTGVSVSMCEACGVGQFSNMTGGTLAATCLSCEPGFIAENVGSSSCVPCQAGSFSSATGASVCSLCEAGYFAPSNTLHGATICLPCFVGTFSSSKGSEQCVLCESGTFTTYAHSTKCENCTSGDNTVASDGSTEKNCSVADETIRSLFLKNRNSASKQANGIPKGPVKARTNINHPKFFESMVDTMRKCHSAVDEDGGNHVESAAIFKCVEGNYFHTSISFLNPIQIDEFSKGILLSDCIISNRAAYGSCIASDFKQLFIDNADGYLAYPGMQISFLVLKKDAYNQTIVSDFSSVLQAVQVIDPKRETSGMDNTFTIFIGGSSKFPLSINPSVFEWSAEKEIPLLLQTTFFYVKGTDVQTNQSMTSQILQVKFRNGSEVCPKGFVLTFRSANGFSLSSCSFCQPGSYSVNPLAGVRGLSSNIPSCLNCPVGGRCTEGGADIVFKIGYWLVESGIYVLKSCPQGYQLVNFSSPASFSHDQQQCKQCLSGQYILNPNSDQCKDCPSGAICNIDDGTIQPKVTGSTWHVSDGVWILDGCPAGYFLNSQQCLLCPSASFCVGGAFPAYPCGSDKFSPPGAFSSIACLRMTFVVVHLTLNIGVLGFTEDEQKVLETGLAVAAGSSEYVQIVAMVLARDGSYVNVTIDIGAADAYSAVVIVDRLTNERIISSLQSQNIYNARVNYVQVTECVPGFYLSEVVTCDRCPAFSFCVGGTSGPQPCPSSTYSAPGGNSSTSCIESVIVQVYVSIPVNRTQFNSTFSYKFRLALSLAASVDLDRITINEIQERRQIGVPNLKILAYIAVQNLDTASTVASRLSSESVNKFLLEQQLPTVNSITITVQKGITGGETNSLASVYIGLSIGIFVLGVFLILAIIFVVKWIRKHNEYRNLCLAIGAAEVGGVATSDHLPKLLRRLYSPICVVGKGAFGCVLKAEKKKSKSVVAIKVILPASKIGFDEKNLRQIRREEQALELLAAQKCEHSVNLVDSHVDVELSWFVMEFLDGRNMETILLESGPIGDKECILMARDVLSALKIMHAEGLIHRDIKPANIMRCILKGNETSDVLYSHKLVDFGSTIGIDETLAKESMITLSSAKNLFAGTPPYMSPEMFKEPERAWYPTDLWSLGVTMFELVTGNKPFNAESDLLWGIEVAGNLDDKAPNVLDLMVADRRADFDRHLAGVISKALEKYVIDRYSKVEEMQHAIHHCLIERGEACYSGFISYRVLSEAPLAHILFDELNNTVTPAGHRVALYLDVHCLVKGEDWERGFSSALFQSYCFFPLMSYGYTAPLARLPRDKHKALVAAGWEEKPLNRQRLQGLDTDPEDNVLKEVLLADALLEESLTTTEEPSRLLQSAYPILVGRQHPPGHANYPGMGSFFDVQGGGGRYPEVPSPPTNKAVAAFMRSQGMSEEVVLRTESRSVEAAMEHLTRIQGCSLWAQAKDLQEVDLSNQQKNLVTNGFTGPAVSAQGEVLTDQQREYFRSGFDERQLRMLKAQVRAKRPDLHEVIDRAVASHANKTEQHRRSSVELPWELESSARSQRDRWSQSRGGVSMDLQERWDSLAGAHSSRASTGSAGPKHSTPLAGSALLAAPPPLPRDRPSPGTSGEAAQLQRMEVEGVATLLFTASDSSRSLRAE